MDKINLLIIHCVILVFLVSSCKNIPASKPSTRSIVSSSLPVDLLWQTELGEPVNRQPIVANKIVVVSTSQAIYGLDIETGQRRWKHSFVHKEPSPVSMAIAERKIIYGDKDGQVTALDVMSGEIIWQHKLGNSKNSYFDINSMVIGNGVGYVASQPTAIEAINLVTGEVIWSIINSSKYKIPGRFARLFLQDGQLYVVTSKVHILDAETGKIKQVIEQNIHPSQLIGGKFYGKNWVREANTLKLISELKSPSVLLLGQDCESFTTPFTFFENQFFAVGRCGGVYSLDNKNYQIQWGYRPEVRGQSPTAIYRGNLYILFNDGEIHAINLQTGKKEGVLETNLGLSGFVKDANFDSRGTVANEIVLIVTFNDKNVWAFCKKPCF